MKNLTPKEIAKMTKAIKLMKEAQAIIDAINFETPNMFLNTIDVRHTAQLIQERINQK